MLQQEFNSWRTVTKTQ